MELATGRPNGEGRAARHYHVIENPVSGVPGFRDDVFRSRRLAVAAARTRAEWLAMMSGLRVERLAGSGRFLVTTSWRKDPGRMIGVEDCDDAECLEAAYGAMC